MPTRPPESSVAEDRRAPAGAMTRRVVVLSVLVAALGYFVDIYDLVLFSILRRSSLLDLHVPEDQLLDVGVHLLNWQMTGMLLGGLLWGILGDKRGRLSVLFGSIFLYSAANIANGFVTSVNAYAWLRLLAGLGLAGELGAGITLVSEILPRQVRGWGTTIVATVGLLGAVAAALVGGLFPWRTSYFIGGGLGLVLLVMRIGLLESGMFSRVKEQAVRRGHFVALLTSPRRALHYACVILTGLPIWFVVGILVTLGPELGKALGLETAPTGGKAIMYCYVGGALGDLASGALSQLLRSRRRVVAIFIGLLAASVGVYFIAAGTSLPAFYACCGLVGFAMGYWAVFVTMASEHFGTNLRATVTTTAPNFVRGATVPMTLAFQYLKAPLGVTGSALAVGTATILIAALALTRLPETFDRDLDFVEAT